jgi:hypothetical protein
MQKCYARHEFQDLPADVASLLASLGEYECLRSWPRDLGELVEDLAGAEPFTIILLVEYLAGEHWGRKKYVDMRRVEIASELDEVVFSHFARELNDRMFEYLKEHEDPEDRYLKKLVGEYYPRAREILREDYKLGYPRSWKRKWRSKRYMKPRVKVEKNRRLEMPFPLCWAGRSCALQFYFAASSKKWVRGCGSGSGTRESHSYFGLAFAELSKRLDIPSYILVYDRDNILRYVDGIETFVLLPDCVGFNCDVAFEAVQTLMNNTLHIEYDYSDDYTEIERIGVLRRQPLTT